MKWSEKQKGNLMIFGTAFLWSFLGIIAKLVQYNGMIVTATTSLAAILVLKIFYWKHRMQWSRLTVLTGLVHAAMNLSFFMANKYTSVANAIVLQYCSPIFVVLFYRVFQKKKMRREQVLSVTVCFVGLLIFFARQLGDGNLFGNLLALFSGVAFAGSFYLNSLPENDPVSAFMVSHGSCVLVGFGYGAFFAREIYGVEQNLIILLGGLLSSGLASVLYASGIQKTSALNANLIAMSEVIMAPMWAFLLFHELIAPGALLGAVLMIMAIIWETVFEAKVSLEESQDLAYNGRQ